MTPFTEKTIKIILSIPKGKVMTYGQIAALAGNPMGARQVARILHSMSGKYKLPWYRVINSKGRIALKDEGYNQQLQYLKTEGVEVGVQGSIDLSVYQWHP